MRRAKIVCTLGPATTTQEQILELARAGMNVARINASHGSHAEHEERIPPRPQGFGNHRTPDCRVGGPSGSEDSSWYVRGWARAAERGR